MPTKPAKSAKQKKPRRFRKVERPVRFELRLSVREDQMLREVMAAEGAAAAELIRRWLKTVHETLGAQAHREMFEVTRPMRARANAAVLRTRGR
jgi:hypothetical protein